VPGGVDPLEFFDPRREWCFDFCPEPEVVSPDAASPEPAEPDWEPLALLPEPDLFLWCRLDWVPDWAPDESVCDPACESVCDPAWEPVCGVVLWSEVDPAVEPVAGACAYAPAANTPVASERLAIRNNLNASVILNSFGLGGILVANACGAPVDGLSIRSVMRGTQVE
jgi:hypothetical protein